MDKCRFSWAQVNDDGFGEHPRTPYTGQEAFDLAVFDGQLYVGMEGSSGSIWRTGDISDPDAWEQVFAPADVGLSGITRVDVLDSLAGHLYIGFERPGYGTQVWRGAPR